MVIASSLAAQAWGGIVQRTCDFTGAGCCAKGSGLAGTSPMASREANKSPFAVWDAWSSWEAVV